MKIPRRVLYPLLLVIAFIVGEMIFVVEDNGIIGPANGSKPREVLVSNNTEDY
jgi:DNA segregation ATPase FtsK/SpoIIIE-like protein